MHCSPHWWASWPRGSVWTVAIAIFSLAAYGVMIVALLLLPETRGRSLMSLEQPAAE